MYAGGLAGQSTSGTIDYCYNTGAIATATSVTGLVYINGFVPNISGGTCYYDTNTTGMNNDIGKGKPKTTSQMKTQSTYQPETNDWTFDSVWSISSSVNGGYPYFTSLAP